MLDGYKEAAKIDKAINKVFKEHKDGDKEAQMELLAFARTIQTTCTIITRNTMELLDQNKEKFGVG